MCLVDAESVEDLRMTLMENGYSVEAVEEILKWYKPNNFDG
jgi:hypothetical protein